MKTNILFVCLGNICRSPAADGIMRHIVEERGLGGRIGIDSAGTYAGQTEDVDSFGVKCLICVDESMDEEMVWRITSILYQNRQRMADEQGIVAPILENGFMYEDLPIPLHEGARRFYEEEGLLGS